MGHRESYLQEFCLASGQALRLCQLSMVALRPPVGQALFMQFVSGKKGPSQCSQVHMQNWPRVLSNILTEELPKSDGGPL